MGINVIDDRASGVATNGWGLKRMTKDGAIAYGLFELLAINAGGGGSRSGNIGDHGGRQLECSR